MLTVTDATGTVTSVKMISLVSIIFHIIILCPVCSESDVLPHCNMVIFAVNKLVSLQLLY